MNRTDAALTHLCINVFVSPPSWSPMKINDTKAEKKIRSHRGGLRHYSVLNTVRENEDGDNGWELPLETSTERWE